MATTRSWVGGQHDFFAASSWRPAGAPTAGDTAVIGVGSASSPNVATVQTAVLSGIHTVLDSGTGTTNAAANPTLSLTNATIANNASIEGSSNFYPDFLAGKGYDLTQNINANGLLLNYGTIDEVAEFNQLNINLGNYTALLNQTGATISAGDFDQLDIGGTGRNALVNNGTVSGQGATIDIATQVFGQGSFNMTDGPGFNSHFPNPGTLEFHQGVGNGQTITLNDSTLILDSPMSFLGTIKDAAVNPAGPYGGNSSVVLSGEQATSLSFQNNVLTVSNGSSVLAQLGFAPGLAANDFTFNSIAGNATLPAGTNIAITLSSASVQTALLSVAPQNQA